MTLTRLFLPLALLCALASAASAQGVTTAAMTGTVTDDARQPLPGATVLAVHEPTGTRYGTITRPDGRYNLTNLQVGGPYSVTVSFVGFQTVQETGITLALGENRTLDVRIREAAAALDEVVVTGAADATFNAGRTGASTNVTTEQIQRLPTISRSIQDFTRLSPQVSGNNVGGRNSRLNTIQLDGAVLNDAFGLPDSGTPGGQVGAQPISLDAIAEFQVEVAPYDVRRGGFTGGLINAVTRRGTNAVDGSVYYFGRNQNFVGRGPVEPRLALADFGEFQTGFRVGGPIQSNRVFFFLSGERRQLTEPLQIALGGGTGTFPADQATLDRVRAAAQGFGITPGGTDTFNRETSDTKLFGRLDFNLSDQHRLTLRHNFVNAGADRGLARNPGSFTLEGQNYVFRSRQNSTVAQLNSTLGANLATEARLAFTAVRDQRDYGNAAPAPAVTIILDGGQRIDFGQERSSQANALDQDIVEAVAIGTYFAGNHTVTFGTDNQFTRFDNLFIQDVFGRYEFRPYTAGGVTYSGIEAFERGRPSLYTFSYTNPDTPGLGERPSARWSYFRAGAFVQDEWRALPGLRVTGGLRVDVPFFLTDPLDNAAFAQAFPGRRTNQVPSGNFQFSPRLGLNYDVTGDRTTQLRGGVGIFSGATPGVWLSNQYSNTGVDILRVDARNRPEGFFSGDPSNQPRPGVTAGLDPIATTAIALTDTDFVLPQVFRTSVGVDQAIPFFGLSATAELQYSQSLNDVFFENINLGAETGTSTTDGRPRFTPRSNPAYTSVILMRNTNQGYTTNATFSLDRAPRRGVYGTLAYTFQQARDVNSGGSSVAFSNWNGNATAGNPNAEVLATSLWETPHRALAALSYSQPVFAPRWNSTFSLIYEGTSGSPFSYVYNGDANGDGVFGNDLFYVPVSQNEQVISDANWATLNAFIEADSYLSARRGQIVERNGARAPWQNRVDLRLAQEVPTVRGQRAEITFDVINALNLVNPDWGFVRTAGRNVQLANFQGYDAATGRARIALPNDFTGEFITPSNIASRWQVQLGLRYSF